ncbi:H(+)/hexose cotransporter 2, partial [Bienertia sinuspersici]
TDDPGHGTRLAIDRSLRRAEGIQPSICEQNFLSEMTKKVEQENASATYVLKNTFQERPSTSEFLPMLGRSIISNSVRWGSNQLRIHAEFKFVPTYHYLAKQLESKKGVFAQNGVEGIQTQLENILTILIECLKIDKNMDTGQTSYVAAFLSCWLCAFVLSENDKSLIRPSTFEIATLMVRGQTFSLAIPILASNYRRLNIISRSSKPAYSGAPFSTHYVYGWLAHYFNTNYVVDPPPSGPLMVFFSEAQGVKCFNGQEAPTLIYEGSKNRIELLFDDGTLKSAHFNYLISLRTGFLPLRFGDSFHIEPYTPY